MSQILRSGAIFIELPHYMSKEKPSPLTVFEPRKIAGVPFAIQRAYWISNFSDETEVRGGHYHPEGGKEEVLCCPFGGMSVTCKSAMGVHIVSLGFDKPWVGLYIPNMVWHEVILGSQSLLLSLASTEFDPNECVSDLPPGCK